MFFGAFSSQAGIKLKQIDYLKLVATGRNSSYYARPSDADEALKGLVGYGAVFTLALTVGLAVLASYLGANLNEEIVGSYTQHWS